MRRAAALALLSVLGCATAPDSDRSLSAPALVEVFSSQGCSGCPPAEDYASRIALRERGYEDSVVLVYHVDTWDGGGWRDPFSSKQMSAQQERYLAAFKVPYLYTPMIVVSGRSHTPSPDQARKSVARTEVGAAIEVSGRFTATGAAVDATITVKQKESRRVEVTLAAAENLLSTSIKGGENNGKDVTESGVVRFLSEPATPDGGGNVSINVAAGKDWKTENVYLVLIVRDAGTRAVLAAKRFDWNDLAGKK